MKIIQQLKDFQPDIYLNLIENRVLDTKLFEKSRELDKNKNLEKTLKEGKSKEA